MRAEPNRSEQMPFTVGMHANQNHLLGNSAAVQTLLAGILAELETQAPGAIDRICARAFGEIDVFHARMLEAGHVVTGPMEVIHSSALEFVETVQQASKAPPG